MREFKKIQKMLQRLNSTVKGNWEHGPLAKTV